MNNFTSMVRKFEEKDAIGRLFGIKPEILGPGKAKTTMQVDERMVNGQNITHGAAIFALVDIALAAAANSHNQVSLALNVSINYLKPSFLGETITAKATEDKLNKTTGSYRIVVENQKGDVLATAQGLVYRKDMPFIEPEE